MILYIISVVLGIILLGVLAYIIHTQKLKGNSSQTYSSTETFVRRKRQITVDDAPGLRSGDLFSTLDSVTDIGTEQQSSLKKSLLSSVSQSFKSYYKDEWKKWYTRYFTNFGTPKYESNPPFLAKKSN